MEMPLVVAGVSSVEALRLDCLLVVSMLRMLFDMMPLMFFDRNLPLRQAQQQLKHLVLWTLIVSVSRKLPYKS